MAFNDVVQPNLPDCDIVGALGKRRRLLGGMGRGTGNEEARREEEPKNALHDFSLRPEWPKQIRGCDYGY